MSVQFSRNASEMLTCFCYSPSALPSTIDPTVAVRAFKNERIPLLNLITHCLHSLANSLYSKSLISDDVRDKACNEVLGNKVRGVALLDCIESRIEGDLYFHDFVKILKDELFLREAADHLVHSYCE